MAVIMNPPLAWSYKYEKLGKKWGLEKEGKREEGEKEK